MDAAILRMLAKIKRGDPEIYDKERAIFEGGFFVSLNGKRLKVLNRGAGKIWATGAVKAQDAKG